MARRNAWPDFVPNEMAERFLNENEQVNKVVQAELEPIIEEEKNRSNIASPPKNDAPKADDGRLAWQYERSDAK